VDVMIGTGAVILVWGMWRVRGPCGCGWRRIVGWGSGDG